MEKLGLDLIYSGKDEEPIYLTLVTPNFSSKDVLRLMSLTLELFLALILVILIYLLYLARMDMAARSSYKVYKIK